MMKPKRLDKNMLYWVYYPKIFSRLSEFCTHNQVTNVFGYCITKSNMIVKSL